MDDNTKGKMIKDSDYVVYRWNLQGNEDNKFPTEDFSMEDFIQMLKSSTAYQTSIYAGFSDALSKNHEILLSKLNIENEVSPIESKMPNV